MVCNGLMTRMKTTAATPLTPASAQHSLAAGTPAVQPVPQLTPPSALGLIFGLGLLLLIVYGPLLNWLFRIGFRVEQLSTGGVLVLFVIAVCVRRAWRGLTVRPRVTNQGMLLLGSAILCLAIVSYLQRWILPFVMASFCLSLAAIISFLMGRAGVRAFAPAFGAILVFGMLAGMFPTLDWPLRAMAAHYAANLLTSMHVPVELALVVGQAPQLLLKVNGHHFIVATECNGFGLLTSSLILGSSLAFFYRSSWLHRVGILLLAMPIAIGCNFLRIVSISLLAPRVPVSYFLVHEACGLLFYYLGLGLIWMMVRTPHQPPPPAAMTSTAATASV